MAVKFKVDFTSVYIPNQNEEVLHFQYNTAAKGLEEQVFKKFVALALLTETVIDPITSVATEVLVNKITVTRVVNEDGTTSVSLTIGGVQ